MGNTEWAGLLVMKECLWVANRMHSPRCCSASQGHPISNPYEHTVAGRTGPHFDSPDAGRPYFSMGAPESREAQKALRLATALLLLCLVLLAPAALLHNDSRRALHAGIRALVAAGGCDGTRHLAVVEPTHLILAPVWPAAQARAPGPLTQLRGLRDPQIRTDGYGRGHLDLYPRSVACLGGDLLCGDPAPPALHAFPLLVYASLFFNVFGAGAQGRCWCAPFQIRCAAASEARPAAACRL